MGLSPPTAGKLVLTALPGLPLVQPGDDLATLILSGLKTAGLDLLPGDILVVAQKVVSKAEGRAVALATVSPSPRAVEIAATVGKDPRFVELVLSESAEVVRAAPGLLVVAHRLGFVMANAGIDQSNIDHPSGAEHVLLLPVDPDGSCRALKARFDRIAGGSVGVVMNDSFGRPWRNGVVGVAIGAAGIPALCSLVGAPDLFGRAMRTTDVAAADEIAAAASLLMGQADEGQPAIHVRGLTWGVQDEAGASALVRPRGRDLFR